MARKMFLGFDYSQNGVAVGTIGSSFVDLSLPPGAFIVSPSSDTTFFSPGQTLLTSTLGFGRNSGSSSLGMGTWWVFGTVGGSCAAVTRASLGNPQEVWCTYDIYLPVVGNASLDDPATMMRSEARFQVFKWGDLTLRIRRWLNNGNSSWTWVFEAFNGATSLGTITLPPYNGAQWAFVRVRARLDSGTAGRFDVTIDGVSLTSGGINSVATTPLANATHLYFSGGALGNFIEAGNLKFNGAIDNILIDDAAFPSGRPAGTRVSLNSDGTLTNWAPNGGPSLSSALTAGQSGTARGTGTGATALLNLGTITTTGWEPNLLGWQIVASGLSNLDPVVIRKLRTGVDLSGTPYSGSQVETLVPPMTPSSLTTGYTMDTIWTKAGSADFTLADIPNTKARLEVVA